MADPRFFDRAGPFRLGEIASAVGAHLGKGARDDVPIHDIAALNRAGPDDLSYFEDDKYRADLRATRAGAVILKANEADDLPEGVAGLIAVEPAVAFARVAARFYPQTVPPERHPSASIDPSAALAEGVSVGPGAVIGPGVEIGAGSIVGACTVIGRGTVIGRACRIASQVSLSHAMLGDRVSVLAGARIGEAGFGFAHGRAGSVHIPQLGRVIIEDDVTIGANVTIDRGAAEDTVIGAGTIIDNLVQIAHNVRVGRRCILVSQVGIAGSTRLGDHVVLGGQAGLIGHLTIGDGVRIAAQAGVMRDASPGETLGGSPAVPVRQWHRQTAALARMARKKGV